MAEDVAIVDDVAVVVTAVLLKCRRISITVIIDGLAAECGECCLAAS